MQIIDPVTKKRLDRPDAATAKHLKLVDPVQREVAKELNASEHSPMDPPDAYGGAVIEEVEYADLHPLMQRYMDEHRRAEEVIARFEQAMAGYKQSRYKPDQEVNEALHVFFEFFDDKLLDHNRREERELFPVLHAKLLAQGEHGTGTVPRTAIDLMEDDHVKFIQLGALTFNLLGLAARLPDARSALFTFDAAYETSRELTETIRLHIYREDNILFPLAHKLLSKEELDRF
jgi:iron-sulfur cluster repair protein YtfE (RIC family)